MHPLASGGGQRTARPTRAPAFWRGVAPPPFFTTHPTPPPRSGTTRAPLEKGFATAPFSRVGGADGLKGTRPMTVSLRPSSNRTGGFPASGFPKAIHSHCFYATACVHAARVGSRYRP